MDIFPQQYIMLSCTMFSTMPYYVDDLEAWNQFVHESFFFFLIHSFIYLQNLPSEIEVKYKIAECYTILKLDKDAISVLDGIPSRQRTPKV